MVDTKAFDPKLGGSIKHKIMNKDLEEERAKRTFDRAEMEEFYLTKFGRDEQNQLFKYMEEHPDLKVDFSHYEATRTENMQIWWRRIKALADKDFERYFSKNSLRTSTTFIWGNLM